MEEPCLSPREGSTSVCADIGRCPVTDQTTTVTASRSRSGGVAISPLPFLCHSGSSSVIPAVAGIQR